MRFEPLSLIVIVVALSLTRLTCGEYLLLSLFRAVGHVVGWGSWGGGLGGEFVEKDSEVMPENRLFVCCG
jgi:hypothetical protein